MQTLSLDASQIVIDPQATYLYPTDSLYGLGCTVTPANIDRINTAKHRQGGKHYSLIAPSFAWIVRHFVVDETIQSKREQRYAIYGPLTLLCQRKDPDFYPYISSNIYVGLRIIDHPLQAMIAQTDQPFISTSANISGDGYDPSLFVSLFDTSIDYHIISTAPMTHQPSTLIDRSTQSVIPR